MKKNHKRAPSELKGDAPLSDADFLKLSADQLYSLGDQLSTAPAKRMGAHEKQRLHETLDALRAQRRPGRPRVGQGAKSVLVSLEGGLLRQIDRYAKVQKMSRSQLIAAALKDILRKKAG